MPTSKIYLSLAKMSGEEQNFVKQAFDTHWVAPLGPNVEGFEKDLETFLGNGKHVVALNSGTAAIHLGLLLLGVQPGDTVICQSFTFVATANPIRYLGAHPVFVDSEPDTWNMSPYYLEKAIEHLIHDDEGARGRESEGARKRESERSRQLLNKSEIANPQSEISKIKAIIPVHLYGMPAKMDEILSIAGKYGIPVLEDAAEALGSIYKGRKCGTFGEVSGLSFNGNKMITTSGGGALVCSTPEQAAKARFYATQARDNAPHYQHSQTGYNYRLSNVCAGIGRGQMTAVDSFISRRREIHRIYFQALSELPGISIFTDPSGDVESNHWLTCLLIDPAKAGFTREDAQRTMENADIETRPLWKPMHLQPLFADCPFFGDGTSEKLFNKGLCLPSGPVLTDEDLDRIIKVFMSLYC